MPLWPRIVLAGLILPGSVAVLIPGLILWATGVTTPSRAAPESWFGIALLAIGLTIAGAATWSFAVRGRGTPAPWDPPTRLVTTGLYSLSRNPMYVAVIAVLLGEAALFRSPWLCAYALAVCVGFHLRIVLIEEPLLAAQFPDENAAYRRRVRRWLGRR